MIEILKNTFRHFRQFIFRFYVLRSTVFKINDASVLIIAPHPDDETFGCAGLITNKVTNKAEVSVIFLSNGENSLKNTPSVETASNRKKTADAVCKKLGVQHTYYLNFTDGNIPRRDTLEYKKNLQTLKQLIESIKPSEVFCTHSSEGWSDHTAASELTFDVLKQLNNNISLYYYWVWVWFSIPLKNINLLNFSNTFYLPIDDVMEQKNIAITTYLTTLNKQGDAYCGKLPKMFLKAFDWPYEVYEKVEYK